MRVTAMLGSFPFATRPEDWAYTLGDYAWILSVTIPVRDGSGYPYPYMPVPQDDYTSGRWLEPGYVPSIPLPDGYPAVACGSQAPSGAAARGGADVPLA